MGKHQPLPDDPKARRAELARRNAARMAKKRDQLRYRKHLRESMAKSRRPDNLDLIQEL